MPQNQTRPICPCILHFTDDKTEIQGGGISYSRHTTSKQDAVSEFFGSKAHLLTPWLSPLWFKEDSCQLLFREPALPSSSRPWYQTVTHKGEQSLFRDVSTLQTTPQDIKRCFPGFTSPTVSTWGRGAGIWGAGCWVVESADRR